MTAPIVAKLTGVIKKKAQNALHAALGVALLWQIAATEEEALGPADASSIAHGRIPLAHLTKRETGRGSRSPGVSALRRPRGKKIRQAIDERLAGGHRARSRARR